MGVDYAGEARPSEVDRGDAGAKPGAAAVLATARSLAGTERHPAKALRRMYTEGPA